MMDYSIRIPATTEVVAKLEKLASHKTLLPQIRDVMYKPVGVNLKNYHPGDVCLRLREFEDGTKSFVEIKTIKMDTGYGDTKADIDLNNLSKYEEWGRMTTTSTEYQIVTEDDEIKILRQKIDPIGEFLKIETMTIDGIQKIIDLLGIEGKEKIERNAAVLLGEYLGLI